MDLKQLSRPLDISNVDFRVQSINNGGYATVLAYKDARVDMNRLDEVLTPAGWQRDYKLIDGKLFCGVGIFNEKTNQWIWKWDVGTESMTEAAKGEASDAFKRACFNLGIGRELYDYPVISVKLREDEWTKDGGRPKQTYNLKIREWKWDSQFVDGKITFLQATDEKGSVRFKWGNKTAIIVQAVKEPVQDLPQKEESDALREMLSLEYKNIFGKGPHGRMSTENIKKEIDTELDRQAKELASSIEVIEDEEPNVPSDMGIMSHVDEISKFSDINEFVNWAKSIVGKYINTEPEEVLDTFKAICNEHFAKIKK